MGMQMWERLGGTITMDLLLKWTGNVVNQIYFEPEPIDLLAEQFIFDLLSFSIKYLFSKM